MRALSWYAKIPSPPDGFTTIQMGWAFLYDPIPCVPKTIKRVSYLYRVAQKKKPRKGKGGREGKGKEGKGWEGEGSIPIGSTLYQRTGKIVSNKIKTQ